MGSGLSFINGYQNSFGSILTLRVPFCSNLYCERTLPIDTVPVRVLHVWPSLDQRSGGPLRAMLDLSAHALNYGLHSEVLGFGRTNVPDNPLDARLLHSLPVTFPGSYCYARELSSWLAANLLAYDGVILHGMWLYPHWATANKCSSVGVPYACFPHGMLEPWSVNGQGALKEIKKRLYWRLRERSVFRRSVALMFTTPRERDLACRTFELPNKPLLVMPYAVAPQMRVEKPARVELIPAPGQRMALFLGRVHPKKNVEFLVDAWAKAQVAPGWLLYVAGPCDANYRRKLEHFIQERCLKDRIRLIGPVSGSNKAYLFERADWFLLPSKQENFGIAVLEAAHFGCPVAVSDQVYISDMFPPPREVLPLELDAWAKFLRERMPNREWQRTIREAQSRALPQFEMERVAAAWSQTMRTVFSHKRFERVAG